jgi:hypothetical protein
MQNESGGALEQRYRPFTIAADFSPAPPSNLFIPDLELVQTEIKPFTMIGPYLVPTFQKHLKPVIANYKEVQTH